MRRVDFNAIARATTGASGAELANIVNEARAAGSPHGTKDRVSQQDLEESVEDGYCRIPEEGCRCVRG